MYFVDVFCGVGGFACGARTVAKPLFGVENEENVANLWQQNCDAPVVRATLWNDDIPWPDSRPDIHVHFSPPCTTISNARQDKTSCYIGIDHLRRILDLVVRRGYAHWSVETVATPTVRAFLDTEGTHPGVSYAVFDAADYGCPSTRKRTIVGPTAMIERIRDTVKTRVSVNEAFARADLTPLTPFIKNNTRTRVGKPCVRSTEGPAHTQVASHPLRWCDASGNTVRCLNIAETAIIMGFPQTWALPKKSRAAFRAMGNAVPPPLATVIMNASLATAASTNNKITNID